MYFFLPLGAGFCPHHRVRRIPPPPSCCKPRNTCNTVRGSKVRPLRLQHRAQRFHFPRRECPHTILHKTSLALASGTVSVVLVSDSVSLALASGTVSGSVCSRKSSAPNQEFLHEHRCSWYFMTIANRQKQIIRSRSTNCSEQQSESVMSRFGFKFGFQGSNR